MLDGLGGRCSASQARPIEPPKNVDIADGLVTWDAEQPREQPDWIYA